MPTIGSIGFNPHRPRRADATFRGLATTCAQFQSSPAPKGRCNVVFRLVAGVAEVSILTGPEGPMQRPAISPICDVLLFQSSPAPKGRCNPRAGRSGRLRRTVSILTGPEGPMQHTAAYASTRPARFQSSPAPKGRCNATEIGTSGIGYIVSILTGPEGPMQPRSP